MTDDTLPHPPIELLEPATGYVRVEHKTYCPPTSMIVGRKPLARSAKD
jgi:hypothetical protein